MLVPVDVFTDGENNSNVKPDTVTPLARDPHRATAPSPVVMFVNTFGGVANCVENTTA
jgi:hypothetical protein